MHPSSVWKCLSRSLLEGLVWLVNLELGLVCLGAQGWGEFRVWYVQGAQGWGEFRVWYVWELRDGESWVWYVCRFHKCLDLETGVCHMLFSWSLCQVQEEVLLHILIKYLCLIFQHHAGNTGTMKCGRTTYDVTAKNWKLDRRHSTDDCNPTIGNKGILALGKNLKDDLCLIG